MEQTPARRKVDKMDDQPPSPGKCNSPKLISLTRQLDSWLRFRSKEVVAVQGCAGVCGLRPAIFVPILGTHARDFRVGRL